MLDRAVGEVFEDCRKDETCAELYPEHESELQGLLNSLRDEPQWITITNPTTGEDQEVRLSAETLAVAIRFLSYASESQAVLPLLIHEALTTGDLSRLAAQAILVMSGLNEMLARGMELSVMCSEDYPFMNFEAGLRRHHHRKYFSPGSRCVSAKPGLVAMYPKGFHEPVVSDVPVLLMSGQRDPVTPPQYAAQAAETFSNSLNLVARGPIALGAEKCLPEGCGH